MDIATDRSLSILVLEDDNEDFELILYALKKDGLLVDSQCVSTKKDFCSALKNFKPDVVLSDHTLPQFNSIEALKICRTDLDIPFILVTGTVSEEFAVNSLKQGADDYILKSNLARLPSAITNALSKRDLEKRRTLAEQDLRLQNEELSKINKEMDSLVYNVSHNIRSPLMSVLGLVELLQSEGSDINLREHLLSLMRISISKLDDTLREILDYSKNSRGEINITNIDLNSLLLGYFENLKFMAGSSEITKKVNIKSAVTFYSDAYRLNIIFGNLISNSIKYRDFEKNNPFINIEVEITEEIASITFQDNGIGISDKALNKVFDMFYRATDKSEGSGLGLYIVREAVDKLGGTISLDSKFGIGTTLKIEIPNCKLNRY